MTQPDRHPDPPLDDSKQPPRTLERACPRPAAPAKPTPEQQRRVLVWSVAATLLGTLAWCFTMFLTRQPAIGYFCICGFIPVILAVVWVMLGCKMLVLMWCYPQPHRRRLMALILLAFVLAPYSLMRAGSDMFTLSLRYHLWRAGGADQVRAAFNQWVATQPACESGDGRKWLFEREAPGGRIVPLPVTQLPTEVRYIHERFSSRFGTTWKDVARLDNVSVLTTTHILIGPPGWEPEGGATLWHHILGSRRKLADGIWVEFGGYNK